MTHIQDIPLAHILRGDNDREYFNREELLNLARSIARDGLAQPVTLRPTADGMFEIVAGERRTRAHWIMQEEGITFIARDGQETTLPPNTVNTIPAIVRALSDEEASAIMLVENTGRVQLNPLEEAQAYAKRINQGYSHEELATMASVSEDLIRRRLALLSLTEDIQHLVKFGNLPLGHAEALTPLDRNRQLIAMRIFLEARNGLTLREFKHIINDLLAEQQQDSLFNLENFWIEQVQQDEMPRRGKRAYVPAPTREDLPPIQQSAKMSAAEIMDQWIADLVAAGKPEEAAVVGTLYKQLVTTNYMSAPLKSALDD